MLSEKLTQELCDQVRFEYYSAYLYLGLSAQLDRMSYYGMSSWLRLQATEEVTHGSKIFDYLLRRDKPVELGPIDQPPMNFASPLKAFEAALAHEQKVSVRIDKLAQQAEADHDYMTGSFLEWFLDEQVEEERTVRQIADRLKLAGDSVQSLFMIDADLAKRNA